MKQILKHFKKDWYKYGLETLVVIVGVLIAFSLSSWNEERKDRIKEQDYLQGLYEDLINNKNSLEFEIELSKYRLEYGTQLRELIEGKVTEIDTAELLIGIVFLGEFTPFQSITNTFEDLKSSGNLDIIRSPEVKDRIANYLYRVDLFESMLYANNQDVKNLYNDKLYEYLSPEIQSYRLEKAFVEKGDPSLQELNNFGFNLDGLKQDSDFLMRLNRVIGNEGQLKIWYGVLLKENLEPAISIIENEIK